MVPAEQDRQELEIRTDITVANSEMAAKRSSTRSRDFRVGYLRDSLSPNKPDQAIGKIFCDS